MNRCKVCYEGATGSLDGEPMCASHLVTHRVFRCMGCGLRQVVLTSAKNSDCAICNDDSENRGLDRAIWEVVDPLIYTKDIIRGIKEIKERCGIGLHKALGHYVTRYRKLLMTHPDKFTVTPDVYWENFYS